MEKPKRQKLKVEELQIVEFWAIWRRLGKKIGVSHNHALGDEYVQYMNQALINFEAESLFMAHEKSDMKGWYRYLEDFPPSPEALHLLVLLGKENYLRINGINAGQKKGQKTRQVINQAIENQGDKTRKEVHSELREKGINQRSIDRHTAGKLKKNTKT